MTDDGLTCTEAEGVALDLPKELRMFTPGLWSPPSGETRTVFAAAGGFRIPGL